jgi:hypothetical protein
MALVTVARAQQVPSINRIASGYPLAVDWLENLLEAASTKVEQYCGRKFELQDYEEIKDGVGTNIMFMTVTPIYSVSEVAIIYSDGTETLYDSGDVRFDPQSGQIRFLASGATFPSGLQNIRFTYEGGYDPIPDPVQEATIEVALQMAGQGCTSNDLAIGAENAGDYTYGARLQGDKHGLFPPVVKHQLEQYRTFCMGTLSVVGAATFPGLVITPDEITANQDNYDPTGLSTANVVRIYSDGAYNITGIVPGTRHINGQLLTLQNINAADDFTLISESGDSDAANRFAIASDYTLAAGTAVILRYDSTSTRWFVVS